MEFHSHYRFRAADTLLALPLALGREQNVGEALEVVKRLIKEDRHVECVFCCYSEDNTLECSLIYHDSDDYARKCHTDEFDPELSGEGQLQIWK
jgi:hypothetical protein